MQPTEVVLSVIPGENPQQRILIVSRTPAASTTASKGDVLSMQCVEQPTATIELKQQTWGESVGWFTQHTISVQESQVATLRASLGVATAITGQTQPAPRAVAPAAAGWSPRVINADSA